MFSMIRFLDGQTAQCSCNARVARAAVGVGAASRGTRARGWPFGAPVARSLGPSRVFSRLRHVPEACLATMTMWWLDFV